MEYNIHLVEMGNKIRTIRTKHKMNQVAFYRYLFPEVKLEEENIKKKMNALENGKSIRINFELLQRIHDKLDVSIDYLLGYETEYKNYENKAVSDYTGLSSEAVSQLHFWSKYKDSDLPEPTASITDAEFLRNLTEQQNKQDSYWILYITSKLLEMKSDEEQKKGIADLSILYDIYMMSLDPPEYILGIPNDIASKKIPFLEKAVNSVQIAANSISYKDSNNEIHPINIGLLNQQIWKERLIQDVEKFIIEIKKRGESCQ